MHGATLTNNGSIISSLWERQIDRMDGTALQASVSNYFAVFIVILFNFSNPKSTLLINLPAPSLGPSPRYSATQAVQTNQKVNGNPQNNFFQ